MNIDDVKVDMQVIIARAEGMNSESVRRRYLGKRARVVAVDRHDDTVHVKVDDTHDVWCSVRAVDSADSATFAVGCRARICDNPRWSSLRSYAGQTIKLLSKSTVDRDQWKAKFPDGIELWVIEDQMTLDLGGSEMLEAGDWVRISNSAMDEEDYPKAVKDKTGRIVCIHSKDDDSVFYVRFENFGGIVECAGEHLIKDLPPTIVPDIMQVYFSVDDWVKPDKSERTNIPSWNHEDWLKVGYVDGDGTVRLIDAKHADHDMDLYDWVSITSIKFVKGRREPQAEPELPGRLPVGKESHVYHIGDEVYIASNKPRLGDCGHKPGDKGEVTCINVNTNAIEITFASPRQNTFSYYADDIVPKFPFRVGQKVTLLTKESIYGPIGYGNPGDPCEINNIRNEKEIQITCMSPRHGECHYSVAPWEITALREPSIVIFDGKRFPYREASVEKIEASPVFCDVVSKGYKLVRKNDGYLWFVNPKKPLDPVPNYLLPVSDPVTTVKVEPKAPEPVMEGVKPVTNPNKWEPVWFCYENNEIMIDSDPDEALKEFSKLFPELNFQCDWTYDPISRRFHFRASVKNRKAGQHLLERGVYAHDPGGVPNTSMAVICGFKKPEIKKPEIEKEEDPMGMSLKNIFGGDIGKDNTGRFKLSMLGLAVKVNDKFMAYNGSQMVDVLDMVVDVKDMIYKIPVADVVTGDLIIIPNAGGLGAAPDKPVYVQEIGAGSIKCFDVSLNQIIEYVPPTNLFGIKYFIKVMSLFNFSQMNPAAGNSFQNMLPMVLMMDGSGDMDALMLMMLMGQGNLLGQNAGPAGAINPMLLMMMMSDKSGGDDSLKKLLPMMMLGGNLFGQQGQTPSLFMPTQQATAAPVADAATPTAGAAKAKADRKNQKTE